MVLSNLALFTIKILPDLDLSPGLKQIGYIFRFYNFSQLYYAIYSDFTGG